MSEFKVIKVKQSVLENNGRPVCPAEFDTGAVKNAMILSGPEGHDPASAAISRSTPRASSDKP